MDSYIRNYQKSARFSLLKRSLAVNFQIYEPQLSKFLPFFNTF